MGWPLKPSIKKSIVQEQQPFACPAFPACTARGDWIPQVAACQKLTSKCLVGRHRAIFHLSRIRALKRAWRLVSRPGRPSRGGQ